MKTQVYGPKRDEVTVEWRRLRDDELDGMCCSPNIIKKMGGACSAYEGELHTRTGFSWGNRRETDHLEDQDIDGEQY
jgi:hypothetical protein